MERITKTELLQLYNAIESIGDDIKVHPKFGYAMAKNKKMLTYEYEPLMDVIKPSDEMIAYERKRLEICSKFCEKDEKGEPELVGQNFIIKQENQPAFSSRVDKLKEKNKEVLDENTKKSEEVNDILKETVEMNLYKIDIDFFPEGLNQSQFDVLMILVKGDIEDDMDQNDKEKKVEKAE